MGQKKNKIILIIIIIVSVLIVIGGLAFVFVATDAFKSNKMLFLKYLTQIDDEEKGIIEPLLKEYYDKQKNAPYTCEGGISVNVNSSEGQEQFKNVNNMNITFNRTSRLSKFKTQTKY